MTFLCSVRQKKVLQHSVLTLKSALRLKALFFLKHVKTKSNSGKSSDCWFDLKILTLGDPEFCHSLNWVITCSWDILINSQFLKSCWIVELSPSSQYCFFTNFHGNDWRCFHIRICRRKYQHFWEIEQIEKPASLSLAKKLCEEICSKFHFRNLSGRYTVSLSSSHFSKPVSQTVSQ